MTILMVCLGNICRSPMMEGWLRDAIAREPRLAGKVEVDSAGIGRWHIGQPPDSRTIREAARHGVDIGSQRARQLKASDFDDFDLILFADAQTLADGRLRGSAQARARTARYLDWAGVAGDPDLADPYQGDADDFSAVWARVAEGGEAIVKRLLREVAA